MCIFGGAPLSTSLSHTLLRWSLIPESYNALAQLQTADIILSTGSSVAAVNLLLGRILGAKTVTCRRPSPIGTRYFDLAILPMISWHQASRQRQYLQNHRRAKPYFARPTGCQTETIGG